MKNKKKINNSFIIIVIFSLSNIAIGQSDINLTIKNGEINSHSKSTNLQTNKDHKELSNLNNINRINTLINNNQIKKQDPIFQPTPEKKPFLNPQTTNTTFKNLKIKTPKAIANKQQIQSLSRLTFGPGTTGFISTWNTSEPGTSANNQISLPLLSSGTYNFMVQWGDGLNDTITAWYQQEVTHTYSNPGIYTLNITGTIIGWQFKSGGDVLKIIEISQWGNLNFGNGGYYFDGASNLILSATDAPDLNETTTLNNAFTNCTNLGDLGSINSWNVSQITDMSYMFYNASSFNQSLSNWDVSHVTNMSNMFFFSSSFNQYLNSWNVSQVTDMSNMFLGASNFNQSLNSWNVSQVTNMYGMFGNDLSFNQPLDSWNVSQVTNMASMFSNALLFNQALNNWNVSQVTDMSYMFYGATSFNGSLDNWNVSQVTDMSWMFDDA